jgi:hypothetical protein
MLCFTVISMQFDLFYHDTSKLRISKSKNAQNRRVLTLFVPLHRTQIYLEVNLKTSWCFLTSVEPFNTRSCFLELRLLFLSSEQNSSDKTEKNSSKISILPSMQKQLTKYDVRPRRIDHVDHAFKGLKLVSICRDSKLYKKHSVTLPAQLESETRKGLLLDLYG